MDMYDRGWDLTVFDIMRLPNRINAKRDWLLSRLEIAKYNLRRSPGHPFQTGVRDACEHYLKTGAIESRGRLAS